MDVSDIAKDRCLKDKKCFWYKDGRCLTGPFMKCVRLENSRNCDMRCPKCKSEEVIQTYQDFQSGYREFFCTKCKHSWNE